MFSPAVATWFRATLGDPTPVQTRAWPRIQAGAHVLLAAPTGSGKTLAAFLAAIDRLLALPAGAPNGCRVLYVSPLKALVYDIERNLRAPLRGILALDPTARPVGVDVRTGDTPARDRARFLRHPAEILVTTPESLYLLLGSAARESLRTVDTVIVDEIHALADSKRGVHLTLSLERLELLTGRPVQRIGLSATVRPLEKVAAWLGGDREVEVVDAGVRPALDLRVEPWYRAVDAAPENQAGFALDRGSGWPEAHGRLLELVRAHTTTILFTNSRRLCERLAQRLNELAGEEICLAHHGSIAPPRRTAIEQALKEGRLRAIVATGTLELGIDMASVDLVVLVESPGSVARGLQRVGRAGHQVGGISKGRIFPRFRADLIECATLASAMRLGDIEPLQLPQNCLDVHAQQVVAMVADAPARVGDLYASVRRAAPYRTLGRAAFDGTLDMLAGRWSGGVLGHLPARLTWDRARDELTIRPGAAALGHLNAGTIPDHGLFAVHLGHAGPKVGELFEEMVFESSRGDVIQLGASSWRIEDIGKDRVVVTPAPGEPGRMPFWRGDGAGRPAATGRNVGAFVREIEALPPEVAHARLVDHHCLHPDAATQLLEVLAEQRAWTGCLPTDRAVTVERYEDEVGDLRVVILSPFGARVHGAWALAIEAKVAAAAGAPPQTLYGDDGITLRFAAGVQPPVPALLFPDPEEVEDLLLERLTDSALFSGRFRENAARALILPRNKPGKRTPLWAQRIRANHLLATVRGWPDFPLLVETARECLQDVLDVPGLVGLLAGVRAGAVRVDEVETNGPSPLARALAWRWVSEWIYALDGPKAERRAQVLTVDRELLRELLGEPDWASLLDPAVIDRVEAELQGTAEGWRAETVDQLHDLLRRVGDLDEAEIAARSSIPPHALLATTRAVPVSIAGAPRWIAVEDAAVYRDALGVVLPAIPASLLAPVTDAFEGLLLRYLRTHAPVTVDGPAARWGLPAGVAEGAARALVGKGLVQEGNYQGTGRRLVATEVLRRIRRGSLDAARGEAAAVDPPRFTAFLGRRHAVDRRRVGLDGLREALIQLEGLALPLTDLEDAVLPARVANYRPALLDELGARGEIVWVGQAPLGDGDGRVLIVRRDRVDLLVPPPAPIDDPLLDRLRARGASFLTELATDATVADTLDRLWRLVWAGHVTNDTFHPLRARGAPRARGRLPVAGGRWGLVGASVDPTRAALAKAESLLDRYGVVGGRTLQAEGATAAWPALRGLEEAGKARRGFFVAGLGGAQLASPGAIDSVREPAAGSWVLAATDPAQPFGALVDWPVGGCRRVAGARVGIVAGRFVFYVAGRAVLLADEGVIPFTAWARARGEAVRIERIDGRTVRESPRLGELRAAGWRLDWKGIEVRGG